MGQAVTRAVRLSAPQDEAVELGGRVPPPQHPHEPRDPLRRDPPAPQPPPPPPPHHHQHHHQHHHPPLLRPVLLHDFRRGRLQQQQHHQHHHHQQQYQQQHQHHHQQQYQQQHQQRRRYKPAVSRTLSPARLRCVPTASSASTASTASAASTASTASTAASFPDLGLLPPELGLAILSYLDATDLCLASCVWSELGSAELLWQALCKSTWGHCSLYRRPQPPGFSYRRLYLELDEGSLNFNANEGLDYLVSRSILDDDPGEFALFAFSTRTLAPGPLRALLAGRRHDVLAKFVGLHRFQRQFLPDALRRFLGAAPEPLAGGPYLEALVTEFARRYCTCNPRLCLTADVVYVLCYSLILLSVDLTSPHVRNKMSKREFIRNTRRAAPSVSPDFAGHLYDNVYLVGHVVPT
uniref:F-box only protein 8 isoform X2 n=1 Tax=Petromyzon marinus TaxID=7757 RepID=A0AAJ7UIB6_PETMA|nr:F-box only protein 8 isoform X2 [Petromyzon marinus]